MDMLNKKAELFINDICSNIPTVFFTISNDGKHIYECSVLKVYYNFKLYYNGKVPSSNDVKIIETLFNSKESLNVNNVLLDFNYLWAVINGKTNYAKSSVKLKNLLENINCFQKKEDAENASLLLLNNNIVKKDFYNKHKKDANYNYDNNGYKFLGWQNGWKHVYYDEDGNITDGNIEIGSKPRRSFGYTKADYPEYGNCKEQKHLTLDVTIGRCEHVVSCPVCKIYWKYDSSD